MLHAWTTLAGAGGRVPHSAPGKHAAPRPGARVACCGTLAAADCLLVFTVGRTATELAILAADRRSFALCLGPPATSAVWNWWLLTLFFLCGSAASLRAWVRKRRGSSASSVAPARQSQRAQHGPQHRPQQPGGDDPRANWLDRAVIAIFATELPVGLLHPPVVLVWLASGCKGHCRRSAICLIPHAAPPCGPRAGECEPCGESVGHCGATLLGGLRPAPCPAGASSRVSAACRPRARWMRSPGLCLCQWRTQRQAPPPAPSGTPSTTALRATLCVHKGQAAPCWPHVAFIVAAARAARAALMAVWREPAPLLQAAAAADALTWLVLVPMLKASEADPARRVFWKRVFLTFESYNVGVFDGLPRSVAIVLVT